MVARKNYGNIKSRSHITIVRSMCIIVLSVYINIYGTLYRHIWTAHNAIHVTIYLSIAYTDCRVMT